MATAELTKEQQWSVDHTKPPFLRRVQIRGYKSIAFCDVKLEPMTILVGRNGAGKSNFLDALAFLRDMLRTSVTDAVNKRGGWSSIVCQTADVQSISIQVDTQFNCGWPHTRIDGDFASSIDLMETREMPDSRAKSFGASYKIEIAPKTESNIAITRESLRICDDTGQIDFEYKITGDQVEKRNIKTDNGEQLSFFNSREMLSMIRPDRLLLSVIGFQPFVDLGENLRWIGTYNFNPDEMRRPQKRRYPFLERDGSNLAFTIDGLEEIIPEQVGNVQQYLSIIAPEVAGFETVGLGEYETIRFKIRSKTPDGHVAFDASNMSDGTLRALASLMAAFQVVLPLRYPSIIGIEEPETSLHPAAANALVNALEAATEQTQIILTTHSAEFLTQSQIHAPQIRLVKCRDGQTYISPIDAASREIIDKELSTLGDLQRMDQLDLDEDDLQRQARLASANGKD